MVVTIAIGFKRSLLTNSKFILQNATLFLARDIMKHFSGNPKNNARIHSRYAALGLASKVTLICKLACTASIRQKVIIWFTLLFFYRCAIAEQCYVGTMFTGDGRALPSEYMYSTQGLFQMAFAYLQSDFQKKLLETLTVKKMLLNYHETLWLGYTFSMNYFSQQKIPNC